MIRSDAIAAFLRAQNLAHLTPTPLPQDASFRRYLRLPSTPPMLLMDAPPPHEDVRPFIAVHRSLDAANLSVPQIHAADPDAGLLLLEDFGDTLFTTALTQAPEDLLYDTATDALAILQTVPPPPDTPRWTAGAMVPATAATFLDWWWPATHGAPPTPDIRADFTVALHTMLAPLDQHALCLTHRDYFAGNLFWLPPRTGPHRIGIIDFQDAALSSPAYDLVSLTQDARRDLPPTLLARQTRRLLAARPALNPTEFEAATAICAAQRHLRVAALWVRLARRDHKPTYLQHGPRCWAMLNTALTHPATAPLADFLARHVPPNQRRNPDA